MSPSTVKLYPCAINSDKAEETKSSVIFSGVSSAVVATRSMLIELGRNKLAYLSGMSRNSSEN